jgi:hypothetical protein
MKKIIAIMFFVGIAGVLSSQKKYEKMVYSAVTKEEKEMTVAIKDAVATDKVTKFQIKISNKSDKILIYKPDESTFDFGGGNQKKPKEKWLIIYPTDAEHRTVNLNGTGYQVPEYKFTVDGVYKVSESEKVVEAPEFQLPPSTNDFKAGNFSCTMINLSKETDKTTVKFECRYTGDKIGVINPGRAGIKLPDGTEIANAKSNSRSEILSKGESTKISLTWNRMQGGKPNDMQLIKMQILWRNTFVESDEEKMAPVVVDLHIDESASK